MLCTPGREFYVCQLFMVSSNLLLAENGFAILPEPGCSPFEVKSTGIICPFASLAC